MEETMKLKIEARKHLIIFVMGFCFYTVIEVVFNAFFGNKSPNFWTLKGDSTFYTGILGGVLLILLGKINEISWCKKNCCLPVLAICGAVIVTLAEFVLGLILNVWLKLNLWTYEGMFLNIMGQVCLLYMVFWIFLAPLAFWLDDLLRWILYKVGFLKSHRKIYSLLWLYRQLFSLKAPKWTGTTTYSKKPSIRINV
jgi:uncharacterized membrane protein